MSKLRTDKWQCTQDISSFLEPNRGRCTDTAVIRCNACRQEYCKECWIDHLEMTVVVKDGALA